MSIIHALAAVLDKRVATLRNEALASADPTRRESLQRMKQYFAWIG